MITQHIVYYVHYGEVSCMKQEIAWLDMTYLVTRGEFL